MILHLTDEMRQALAERNGVAVLVVDPATQQQYVLLSAGEFQKMQGMLFDGSPPDLNELMPLAHDAFAEDWSAPGMDAYENLPPQSQAMTGS